MRAKIFHLEEEVMKVASYRSQGHKVIKPSSFAKASSFVKALEDRSEGKQSYKVTGPQSQWHVIGSNDNVSGETFIEKVIKYLRENASER
ncbi:MAG: hypothetical protein B1H08_01755, partial [Candidatus Omnitrophica bacterium 4484_171]